MIVRWTDDAEEARAEIWRHIVGENPSAAAKLDRLFKHAAARLAEHPQLGRRGMVAGTRELIPHERYRLIYQIEGEIVWIVALLHTAREWPPVQR